jgi:hypothetical protein
MSEDAGERVEASGGASGYTRQSDEIEPPLSSSVSLRTASYLTPGGDVVIGVVRYVRGERKRALYIPIGQARSVADAIVQLVARHGDRPV